MLAGFTNGGRWQGEQHCLCLFELLYCSRCLDLLAGNEGVIIFLRINQDWLMMTWNHREPAFLIME